MLPTVAYIGGPAEVAYLAQSAVIYERLLGRMPVDAGYAPASQPPVVIINQNFRPDTVNPVMRDYSETPLPESTMRRYDQPGVNDDQPTVFLIALKDHTIFPAVAYWVEGDTLNYITTQGSLNRASLELVDREFSKQLNDERHIEFRLPAAK